MFIFSSLNFCREYFSFLIKQRKQKIEILFLRKEKNDVFEIFNFGTF